MKDLKLAATEAIYIAWDKALANINACEVALASGNAAKFVMNLLAIIL